MLAVLIYIALFLLSIFVSIKILRYMIRTNSKVRPTGKKGWAWIKKNPAADLAGYENLFFAIGLVLSLAAVITVFEWKTYSESELKDLGTLDAEITEVMDIPVTKQPPPPAPKIVSPKIVEVADMEEIEDEIEIDLSVEIDQETVVEQSVTKVETEAPEEEEESDEIFTIVEESSEPVGGMAQFYRYVGENMKYPKRARNNKISGKVYVQFVVDKDGTLTNVHTVKGIGFGCNEAAEKVLREAPKWNPGKQRGQPIRQQIVMPIIFKLQMH